MKFGAETPGLHGGIFFHQLSSFLDRRHLEDVEATQIAVVIKWSGGYEDLVLHHFSDVGHVGLLDALGFRLRERFPVRDGPEKYEVVEVQIVTGRSGLATETGAKGE